MNRQEREELMGLLTDLISAQDFLTHENETGTRNLERVRKLIAARNDIRDNVLSFVESLTEK